MHGGLSPKIKKVEELNKIDRFSEVPEKNALCDILWSDPVASDNGKLNNKDMDFVINSKRKCSFYFG